MDESLPLLDDNVSLISPRRFPKLQFAILCLLRTLDPLNFTQIFPYVNDFVKDLHVTTDLAQIGFYSGLLESSFAFFQLLSIYPWGLLSDRFGRRPLVLVGLAGLCIATISFGLSSSFTMAILSRALAGLFSGNVTVVPSMVCEITTEKSQAFAYSFFGLWWPLGAIIGPLLGGLFSNPATRYPRYFNNHFLRNYPYFLPCLIASACTAFGLLLSTWFLKETLGSVQRENSTPAHYEATTSTSETTDSKAHASASMGANELLKIPILRALCLSGCTLSFMSTSFEVLFVLFCYSPIGSGGLGFSVTEIGFALSTAGLLAASLQVLVMPILLRRVNHALMYHSCMKLWPYAFILMPLLNVIAKTRPRPDMQQLDSGIHTLLWICVAAVLSLARIAHLPYTINVLLVKRYAPHPATLGTVLALVQLCICCSRAVSPAVSSLMFTFSVKNNILSGNAWVIFMALAGFMTSSLSKAVLKESAKLS